MPETYYDRLGVPSDASTAEIRRAYRERLKRAHPDVSDAPDAAAQTKRLIEAKEVLTDEYERGRYDRLGHRRYVEYHDQFVEPGEADVAQSRPGDGPTGDGATTAGSGHAGGGAGDRSRANRTTDGRWGTADASTDRESTDRAKRRRQNRETRAAWNTAGDEGTATATATARGWRAWDTDAPYRVYAADRSPFGSRLFPSGPSLVLLAVGFAIYPLLLWASLEPAFPLAINLVLGVCLLLLIGFLVGMPAVGVAVFGSWSVLLPVALTVGFGVPPLSPVWLIGVAGTVLPLGLALLIAVALRA